MKRSIIVILLTISFMSVLFAQEEPRRGFGPGPRPAMMEERGGLFMRTLDLTDEQRSRIEALRLEHQKDMIPLKTELEKLNSEYRLMVVDDKVSQSEIENNLKKQNEYHMKLKLAKVNHLRDIRSILTEEQRNKFDSHFLERDRGPGKGHHGPGHGKRHYRRMN